jgi:hypothetical protein
LDGFWRAVVSRAPPECKNCSDIFELELRTEGHRICGAHFATARFHARVDNGEGAEGPTMSGTARGDSAVVTFESTWGGGGTAKLSRRGGRLLWEVVRWNQGVAWLPERAELKRAKPGHSALGQGCTATDEALHP